MIGAVLFRHVTDDFISALLAEVNIDIGHADAAWIEEAFEKEPVTYGIDIGDAQGVCDKASGRRASSRTDRNLSALCVIDEIRNDQKIAGKTHRADHLQFLMQPALVPFFQPRFTLPLGRMLQEDGQETFQTLLGRFPKDFIETLIGADLESRQIEFPEFQRQVAALGDLQCVFDRLRTIGKEGLHFLRRTKVELVGCEAHAVRALHGLPGLDTEKNLMRFGIRRPEIVAVVRRDQGQRQAPCDLHEPLIDGLLFRDSVFHNFQEEVALAEQFPILRCGALSRFILAAKQKTRNLSVQTRAQGNETFMMLGQQRLVDPGAVIETLQISRRGQLHQVSVALKVLRQQDQMAGGLAGSVSALVKTACGGNVGFASDDRLDAVSVGCLIEADGAEHVPVIGQGDRRHLVFLRRFEQRIEPDRSVEKTELRMDMQMDKVRVFHVCHRGRCSRPTVPPAEGQARGRRSRFGGRIGGLPRRTLSDFSQASSSALPW